MSVTYGFYNSIKGDRKYNALEMSSIFDGIIVDGVYMSIGDALNVKSSGGMGITVGIGRAWFNHTWTLNDSLLPLTLANSDVLLNRIDAIVLEVNNNTEVRKNTIKILKGTPSSKPVKPTMTEGELLNQHPLAYISIPAGATSISQSNIENAVGTSACPYVTGVLKGMDIDKLVAQWGAQWAEWLSSNTDAWKAFMSDNTNEWKSFMAKNKNEWSALINGNTSEFETWFEHMKDQLSEDAAGNLQLQVDNLNNAALGGDFVLKGSPVSVEYMGANRIASITAYGENAQGGTTEAPVALTGISSITVNDDVTELPIPRPLRRVGDVKDKCVTRQKHEGAEKLVVTYNVGYIANYAGESITTAWISSTGALSTGAEVAYVLSSPETYATDPLDIDNAAGPLTVLTGGELEAAFKSADKVVESRIDFVEDTLNEQGQAIAEKAPISHSSDKSTYGLGSGSQFGHVKLSDATASGSNSGQGIAATPSAVNQVHAKANAAQSTANAAMPKAGGTFTGTVAAKTENIAGAYIRNISVQNSASQLQYTNFIIMVRK